MRKIIPFSTVILFLAILLVNCSSCNSAVSQKHDEVTIELQAVITDGKKHLKLSDSNGNFATDHLVTVVSKGGTITWKLKSSSKIIAIKRIYTPETGKEIFIEDARQQGNSNVFKLKVPDGVASGTLEKYNIIFIHKDGSTAEIDPYIRIE
ncbi:MAG: hypothetical protein HZB98_12125 [Bacteroidia bacterium]|nr:hypothetical protein [Bacteroidia bacterium]